MYSNLTFKNTLPLWQVDNNLLKYPELLLPDKRKIVLNLGVIYYYISQLKESRLLRYPIQFINPICYFQHGTLEFEKLHAIFLLLETVVPS